MNVACPECSSVFRVDPAKVPAGGVRARCSVCGAVMRVDAPPTFGEDAWDPSGAGRARTPAHAGRQPTPRRVTPPSLHASPDAIPSWRTSPAPPASAPRYPAVAGSGMGGAGAPLPPTASSPEIAPEPAAATPVAAAPVVATAPRPSTPVDAHRAASAQAAASADSSLSDASAQVDGGFGVSSRASTPPIATTPVPGPAAGSPPADSYGRFSPPPSAAPLAPAPRAPGLSDRPARPPINPFLANDPNQKAKRLARALVSDIVAYHPQQREQGLREGTLRQLFKDEIKKSYEEYVEQVGADFAESTAHFQDALNDILASGRKMF